MNEIIAQKINASILPAMCEREALLQSEIARRGVADVLRNSVDFSPSSILHACEELLQPDENSS